MRIKCPKCGKIYDVSENELPAKGRRMRCSGCGEVFWRRPEDADDSFSAWTDEKTNTPDEEPQWNEIKNAVPESEEKDWEEIKVEKNTPPAFEETKEMPSAVTPDDARSEENAPASDNAAEEEGSSADEAEKTEETATKPDGVDDIFKRLSEQSAALSKKENEQPVQKKIWGSIRKNAGLMNKTTRRYVYFLLFFVVLLLFYYFRYEIVRTFPFMEQVYSSLDIQSKVLGEGLEFKNVSRRNYEDDYVTKMEIKGFIVNNTEKMLEIPDVKLEVMDEKGLVLDTLITPPPAKFVKENGRVAFSVTVTKPSPLSKYIYLTFTEKKK